MAEYSKTLNKVVSQRYTSISKLFELTVLSKAYKDDEYFHAATFGTTRENGKDHRGFYFQTKSSKFNNFNCDFDYDNDYGYGYNYNDKITLKNGHVAENGNISEHSEDSKWKKWGWWQPHRKHLLFEFFKHSSMHGLKFIAQPRRHMSERIFLAMAFILAIAAAGFLIDSAWKHYAATPVIVTFAPTEQHINTVPFPAVTICNMNKISLDLINHLTHRAKKNDTGPLATAGKIGLQYAGAICKNSPTFANRFKFGRSRGRVNLSKELLELENKTLQDHVESGVDLIGFEFKSATPCQEMILKCIWAGVEVACKKFFKPWYTQYGMCCAFNKLPASLILSENTGLNSKIHGTNKDKKEKSRWSPEEVRDWKKWDYTKGFLLENDTMYPLRQLRSGAPFGLSVLLDPNLDRYFCQTSDSQGFHIGLNSPLEVSTVERFGIAIGLDRETNVNIRPELTIADPDIQRFDFNKRKCMFQHELNLEYFQPYTHANCIMECQAKTLARNCSCVPYTLTRNLTTRVCTTRWKHLSNSSRKERDCVRETLNRINGNMRLHCAQCISVCSQLSYRYKISTAKLQNSEKLWFDHDKHLRRPPDWAGHKMAVVHLFFGRDEFVPLLRSELYRPADLIANTGNVLSLCLGFSIMSAAEIVFFFAIRPCWDYFRKRRNLVDLNVTQTETGTSTNTTLKNTTSKGGDWNQNQNGNYKLKFQTNENHIHQRQRQHEVINMNSIANTNQAHWNSFQTNNPFTIDTNEKKYY